MAGVMKTYINGLYESSIWKKDNGQCDRFKDDDIQKLQLFARTNRTIQF